MNFKFRSFTLAIFTIYSIILWYIIHKLYHNESNRLLTGQILQKNENIKSKDEPLIVEIWGKASIGDYLWQHVFSAHVTADLEKGWSYGEQAVNGITFRYRTGPGVIPSKVPETTENLVLVLNGREKSKVEYAQMWLNYLPVMENLKRVALVILGNEECHNGWLHPYLASNGGYLRAVFMVYDSPSVDDVSFFQWPLGVATYRKFPTLPLPELRLGSRRAFKCNFIGTVYPNSSREILMKVIAENGLQRECFVKPRYQWLPLESPDSMSDYTKALLSSDLTLNPVGKNTESYRIYEAMSLGSVPVIEDVTTPGECGGNHADDPTPLRLLKQYRAPVLYVKSWLELPELLVRERSRGHREVVTRRKALYKWYSDFKGKIKEKFVNSVNEKFFREGESR